jgi:hypothetical protein
MYALVHAELHELADIEDASKAWDPEVTGLEAMAVSNGAMLCRSMELGWTFVPDGVPPGSNGRLQCLRKQFVTAELKVFDAGRTAEGRNRFEYVVSKVFIGDGALAFDAMDKAAPMTTRVCGHPVFSLPEARDAFRRHARVHGQELETLVVAGYMALHGVFKLA